MLKKRIIPIQLLLNNRLVKTVGFDTYRDVGDPVTSSKVYSDQDADELILLNIDRSDRSVKSILTYIERISEVCFMPLSIGGGISSIEDVDALIKNGADKIVINSAAYTNKKLISEVADKYGSQAVVIAMDAKFNKDKQNYDLYSHCGKTFENISLHNHIDAVVKAGAGEILINSIQNDGRMSGYDIQLLNAVTNMASVPVIGCGGAGNYEHLKEGFLKSNVSALACGSLFNFGDNNPIRAKAFLSNYNLPFKVI